MQRMLDSEVFIKGNTRGFRDAAGDFAHHRFIKAGTFAVIGDWNFGEDREKLGAILSPIVKEVVIEQILLHHDAEKRGQAERIGAGAHSQMVISHLGGLGAAWIDRPAPLRIGRDVTQNRRARWKPCDCQGFLPTKTATSVCSKSPRTPVPNITCSTQNSPVFSCANALELKTIPSARRVDAP